MILLKIFAVKLIKPQMFIYRFQSTVAAMLLMFVLLTWNNDGIIRRYDRCDNYTASMSHFKMRPALKVNRRCALATPEKMECFGAVNYDFPHLEPKVTSL